MSEKNRIEDLEILVAHQARTIEELSDELRKQGDAIVRLQTVARNLGDHFQALEDMASASPEAKKPPHY